MARPATGTVVEQKTKHGRTFAIRYRANGQRYYETVGTSAEGVTRRRAEEELANVLADIRRGQWQPPANPAPQVPQHEQTFDELADEWIADRKADGLGARTIEDYEWALGHLRAYFGPMALATIDVQAVDTFRRAKVAEGILSPNSINKVLSRASMIFDLGCDYGRMSGNPARGRRRRLKATKPLRSYVEPEQLPSLLEAAEGMYDGKGRVLIATLAGAGLRIGEALALQRGDVKIANGYIHVRKSKTKAGEREVNLGPGLREELTLFLNDRPGEDDALLFGTRTGAADSRNNVRRRLIVKAVEAANLRLVELGIDPIGRLSPHGLRHTYASLRSACGFSAAATAKQIGHVNALFTVNTYTHASEHAERLSGSALEQYKEALEWAGMGSNDADATELVSEQTTGKRF
jgi:integrase